MDISNLFQLTDEDKAQYKKLIDEIDLDNSSSVIVMLNTKLETLLSVSYTHLTLPTIYSE